ncbi:protein sidekick-2 [Eurytemora carolleeae]|uniref:protein sidekick-2 n=1 Tax=Eurytemora carolleeae TaxID=1294199 RepID=UPI000C76C509|nr:protein sidekick-2 [Eurytemora carolleeae]|eukprot:XP_023346824.1 protein sidekick-2-like [Eurytemora affinis]
METTISGIQFALILVLGNLPCLLGGAGGLADIYDSPVARKGAGLPELARGPQTFPEFVPLHSGNVTTALGKTALLNCRVRNVNNKTVSWIRHRDILLLAIGRYTYTSDYRFKAIHKLMSEDYLLQIRPVQMDDAGLYECQVSSTPPLSHHIYLSVAEPYTEIVGGPEIYLDEGSMMNITCLVKDSPEPPNYIFWYHNDKSLTYDSPRGGVSQITEKGDITVSYLLVQSARLSDTGTYTCQPSVGLPAVTNLHVIRGKDPEKWLTNSANGTQYFTYFLLLTYVLLVLLVSRS